MESLFWAYAVVWVLHVGYLLSLAVRQNSLRQEISTMKALIEQKGQSPVGRCANLWLNWPLGWMGAAVST